MINHEEIIHAAELEYENAPKLLAVFLNLPLRGTFPVDKI